MKATGKCCKCGGKEIYSNSNQPSRGERSSIAGSDGKNSSKLWLHVYACLGCGFVEEYIDSEVLTDDSKMTKLKDSWESIN